MAEKPKKTKKSKKKLLMIVVPIAVLLVGGVGYKMVLAKKPVAAKMKIDGTIVPLADDFVVNLADGHYGKITVALLVTGTLPAAQGSAASGTAPVLPETPVIRSIITDQLTGLDTGAFIDRARRQALVANIAKALRQQTDTHVKDVYFTDIAVQ